MMFHQGAARGRARDLRRLTSHPLAPALALALAPLLPFVLNLFESLLFSLIIQSLSDYPPPSPPLPSDDEIVRRLRCPESDLPRHNDKAHHLQFMMRVVTVMRSQPQLAQWMNEAFGIPVKSRRRLNPGLGTDSTSRRYREALDSLVRACELERASSTVSSSLTLSGDALAPPDENVHGNETPGACFAKAPTALTASTLDLPTLLTPS
eukprot:2955010-Pleurochrysis_carterae.AAC.1